MPKSFVSHEVMRAEIVETLYRKTVAGEVEWETMPLKDEYQRHHLMARFGEVEVECMDSHVPGSRGNYPADAVKLILRRHGQERPMWGHKTGEPDQRAVRDLCCLLFGSDDERALLEGALEAITGAGQPKIVLAPDARKE